MDVSLMNKWKTGCLRVHGEKCHNPLRVHRVRPSWLIDTLQACVVPGTNATEYVAVSYLWEGRPNRLRYVASIRQTSRPHALLSTEISAEIPPTIKHAIGLTPKIGERYLWADILCIDYEDEEATNRELNAMGAIYAGAIITIISDSPEGLLGLQGVSSPRKAKQISVPFKSSLLINDELVHSIGGEGAHEYRKRAWTDQEYLFSSRKLVFCNGRSVWQCQRENHVEERFSQLHAKRPREITSAVWEGLPDLYSLSILISDFNRRDLSYEEDALSAIAGALQIMSRTFRGGFLYGLPVMFFDLALTWQPRGRMRRRQSSGSSQLARTNPCALPSWSWIGWKGSVDLELNESLFIVRYGPRWSPLIETIPTTTWYTGKSSSNPGRAQQRRRRLRPAWFEERDKLKESRQQRQPGWTTNGEIVGVSFPEGCGSDMYSYENDSSKLWYYPFPVADAWSLTVEQEQKQTPLLFCDTQFTYLWATSPTTDGSGECQLENDGGQGIGRLVLHYPEQWDELSEQVDQLGRKSVKLATICRKKVYCRKKQTFPNKNTLTSEDYTVLCVEEREGIHYRLGVGDVDQEGWEAQDLQDISLVLG